MARAMSMSSGRTTRLTAAGGLLRERRMVICVPTVITSAASGTGATLRAAARRDRAHHPRTVEGRGLGVGAAMATRGKRMDVVAHAALNLSEDSSFDEEMAVPKDQRPVNELKSLQQAPLYSWGELPPATYARNLGLLWLFFFGLIGGPVAAQTYPVSQQPLQFFLAAGSGGLVPVVFVALRVYLGWSYVGNRLLSAVVEYEETGWYDGQIWVKSPEVLSRDRLLGNYKVKPTLARMKNTMLATAAMLAFSSLVLTGVLSLESDDDKLARKEPQVYGDGLVYSKTLRGADKETIRARLMEDDDVANEEAAAAGGVPGYCGDRYYKCVPT